MTAATRPRPGPAPAPEAAGPPVALVSGDFVRTGGMDRANYALAAHLLGLGRTVHLVAYRVDPALLASPNAVFHRAPKPLGSYLLGHPVLSARGSRRGRSVAAEGGRVVVNGGNCRFGDVNWLHHINALDPPRTSGGPLRRLHRSASYRLFVREDRAALREARRVVTTCHRNKADLIDWLGTDPGRIDVIPYGADPDAHRPAGPEERAALRARFGWPSGCPVFLFVGALGDRRKGFDTLFRAWSILCRDASWDGRLVVAGSGAELPAWRGRAASSGLAGRVEFLGFRGDVPDLLRAADAHVLPSRYEGYSLATQEALCCGLPAFVTATAGIAERYPSALQGLLIPDPDDADVLADRLRAWRDRPGELSEPLGEFAAALRSFTWDDMAAEFLRATGIES